jgi:hypothetical protein
VKAFGRTGYLLHLRTRDVEDAKAKQHGMTLPYRIPNEYQPPGNRQSGDADDVTFNPPSDDVPSSSIEENSIDVISADAEGIGLFESGREAVEEYDDAHVVFFFKSETLLEI